MSLWRHRNTGQFYKLLAVGVDHTNQRCGTPVVVYCPDDDGNCIFVREEGEFMAKFEHVTQPN